MIWASSALIILLILAGLIELGARILQLRSLVKSHLLSCERNSDEFKLSLNHFVSVHVATYNEPSKLVIHTLKSLADSRCINFEVIIIDNNTTDASLWLPVADAAKALGDQFRFVHIDRLSGAKAGALNVALSLSDPRTTHVAIVDADYQVDCEFLNQSVHSIETNGVDYVQFPQAYRGVGLAGRGIEHELGDYFACFSIGAGRPGSMLPTGTLSMFTASALKAVGGWSTETITEDAEIGVRLQAAGYRGLWLARDSGRGLLPVDFRGLAKQRARWAAGNLQVLKRLHQFEWLKLQFGDLVNLVMQLTAWISLLLPASIALLFVGVVRDIPLSRFIAIISALTILGSAALTGLRIVVLSAADVSWRVRFEALATKTALTWTSALAWIPAMTPYHLKFHRTAKTIDPAVKDTQPLLGAVSVIFLGVGGAYTVRHQYIEAAACAFLASIWICARSVDTNLRLAAASNPDVCG